MTIGKKKEIPYNQTKEYLQRQQDIDALLVLTKITEVGNQVGDDVRKTAVKKIELLLDRIK